jgi:predicted dehydrogenase
MGRVVHLNSPAPLPSPDLAQIQTWIDEHDLGRPIGCRSDVWVRYHQQADGSWYDDPRRCPVAPIFRLGIYLINDIVRFFGEPRCVQVLHSRIFTGKPTPDNAQLGILFENGALANVYASFCIDDAQYYKNSLVMNFERGTVYRSSEPLTRQPEDQGCDMAVVAKRGESNVVDRAHAASRSGDYQWDVFYRAVRGEKPAGEITPEQIVAGLRVIEAMRRAEQSGKAEEVIR